MPDVFEVPDPDNPGKFLELDDLPLVEYNPKQEFHMAATSTAMPISSALANDLDSIYTKEMSVLPHRPPLYEEFYVTKECGYSVVVHTPCEYCKDLPSDWYVRDWFPVWE